MNKPTFEQFVPKNGQKMAKNGLLWLIGSFPFWPLQRTVHFKTNQQTNFPTKVHQHELEMERQVLLCFWDELLKFSNEHEPCSCSSDSLPCMCHAHTDHAHRMLMAHVFF